MNQSEQKPELKLEEGERGIALLITVFVIAIGTIVVFELGRLSRYDQRSARAFAERIQGNYIIRSGFNLGQIILALPKPDGGKEDWLGDIWSKIGMARELPIEGLPGATRIQIVDESSKMNVNWLALERGRGDRWRERFALLFNELGYERESYGREEHRTLGDNALDYDTQVAVLSDWIDEDKESFSGSNSANSSFMGKGFEAEAPIGFFYNREFKTLNELLLAPGMTRERLSRAMPFIRVDESSAGSQKINVNTAKYETLVAIGYPESTAAEIVSGQMTAPISQERLQDLNKLAADPTIAQVTGTSSKAFSVVVRVKLPNSVRWGRAMLMASGGNGGPKATSIRSIELY